MKQKKISLFLSFKNEKSLAWVQSSLSLLTQQFPFLGASATPSLVHRFYPVLQSWSSVQGLKLAQKVRKKKKPNETPALLSIHQVLQFFTTLLNQLKLLFDHVSFLPVYHCVVSPPSQMYVSFTLAKKSIFST